MRQKKLKLLAVLGCFLVLVVLIMYLPSVVAPDRTKAKMIELALKEAVVKQAIPDFGLIKDKRKFLLSTENISPNLMPKFSGLDFLLLTPQEIQRKADAKGDFLRLRFTDIKVGVFKSTVSLDNS